eukprot:755580-Hanusia_phi.AAC.1
MSPNLGNGVHVEFFGPQHPGVGVSSHEGGVQCPFPKRRGLNKAQWGWVILYWGGVPFSCLKGVSEKNVGRVVNGIGGVE